MARSSGEENRYDYLVLPLQQLGACGQGHEGRFDLAFQHALV
jgi:hypothetical protein